MTYPGGTWPVGVAFQINLVTSTMSNQAILAQSPQFNISNSGSVQETGVSPTTVLGAATTPVTPTVVTVATAAQQVSSATTLTLTGDASGGIPNAVSVSIHLEGCRSCQAASSRSAGDKPSPSAFISLLISAAALFGIMA